MRLLFVILFAAVIVYPLSFAAEEVHSEKSFRPPIDVKEALKLAEAYVREHKIDLSRTYIDSIRVVENNAQNRYWEIHWQSDTLIVGGDYLVVVGMDKSVRGIEGH